MGPDLSFEQAWLARDMSPVCGIDEAGRGPWAGPVVAAAVVLDAGNIPRGINDSKQVGPEAREALFEAIMRSGADVGCGIASVERIDRDNILQATFWAMRDAVANLKHQPRVVLIDGNRAPPLTCPVETIVKGDARSLSIAAASIIAKVTRDRLMTALALTHPGYGWERNMGYGVPEHRAAIAKLGLTPHHRRSFRPIALALEREPTSRDTRAVTNGR